MLAQALGEYEDLPGQLHQGDFWTGVAFPPCRPARTWASEVQKLAVSMSSSVNRDLLTKHSGTAGDRGAPGTGSGGPGVRLALRNQGTNRPPGRRTQYTAWSACE